MQRNEQIRLEEAREQKAPWKKWGPYLSERQWGTVREDYSENGDAWNYFTHDQARSRAYRWGEDGLGGISDDRQQVCFALALWNGKDPILKERLFGLTNSEGNHGEDVKEYYFYLDSTPTHSYMKYLYKYPQAAYPYNDLIATNRDRGRGQPEYELLDTGVFDEDRYFDVFVEYAKASPEDCSFRSPCTTAARNRQRSNSCPPSGSAMTGRGGMMSFALPFASWLRIKLAGSSRSRIEISVSAFFMRKALRISSLRRMKPMRSGFSARPIHPLT